MERRRLLYLSMFGCGSFQLRQEQKRSPCHASRRIGIVFWGYAVSKENWTGEKSSHCFRSASICLNLILRDWLLMSLRARACFLSLKLEVIPNIEITVSPLLQSSSLFTAKVSAMVHFGLFCASPDWKKVILRKGKNKSNFCYAHTLCAIGSRPPAPLRGSALGMASGGRMPGCCEYATRMAYCVKSREQAQRTAFFTAREHGEKVSILALYSNTAPY